MKKPAKVLHYFGFDCGMLVFSNILLTSRNPKNNCGLSCIFGARFGGKDRGLCSIQTVIPTSRRLDSFFYEAAQNFEVF
jgi:hypothetical protein